MRIESRALNAENKNNSEELIFVCACCRKKGEEPIVAKVYKNHFSEEMKFCSEQCAQYFQMGCEG